MNSVLFGWLLLAAAAAPALSRQIETGVTTTIGLWCWALAGICMIAGTGDGTWEWLLGAGAVLVALGEWLHWRRCGKPSWHVYRSMNQVGKR